MMYDPPWAANAGSTSTSRTGAPQPAQQKQQLMAPIHLGRGLPYTEGGAGAQELLAFVEDQLAAQHYLVPRLLLVDYYISLRTHRFVVLLGPEGQGKADLARI